MTAKWRARTVNVILSWFWSFPRSVFQGWLRCGRVSVFSSGWGVECQASLWLFRRLWRLKILHAATLAGIDQVWGEHVHHLCTFCPKIFPCSLIGDEQLLYLLIFNCSRRRRCNGVARMMYSWVPLSVSCIVLCFVWIRSDVAEIRICLKRLSYKPAMSARVVQMIP